MRWSTLISPIVLAATLVASACTDTQDGPIVRGRVYGADGASLQNARLAIRGMGHRESGFTADDGSFEFRVPMTGAYFVTFTGLHHQSIFRPVYLEADGPVELDVRLAAASYLDELDTVFVIGSFNDFDDDDGLIPMELGSDGVHRLALPAPADTFAYQLMGVQVDDYRLAGTAADRYVFDAARATFSGHAGKYISVLDSPDDSVEIVFDPGALARSDRQVEISFADPDSRAARISATHDLIQHYRAEVNALIDRQRTAGQDIDLNAYDWDRARSDVASRLRAENDSVLYRHLLISYFENLRPSTGDSILARNVLADVPPKSTLWSFVWSVTSNTLNAVSRVSGREDETDAYAMRMVNENPDSTVKADILSYLVWRRFSDMQEEQQRLIDAEPGAGPATREFSILFDRLMSEFGDTDPARRAKQQFAPDRAIQAGNVAPLIAGRVLEDTSRAFDPAVLRDRVTLVEFWALWCGPCIGEMSYLHDAYEKYRDRGFNIVSVSFDENPRDVAAFRNDEWPMPWTHVWVEDGFQGDLAEAFEVAGIPKPVLLDESGTILASQQDLRRENLDEVLSSVFDNRDRVPRP